MADTFVKKPMVVVGTKDQVVAEMGVNDFGIATDVSFYTAQEIDVKLADKQDTTTAINYDNITNCITEIPQDIKLELNNGTLTLKAGSKVYVPNGSDKFNAVTTTADMSATRTDSQVCMVWRYPSGSLGIFPIQLFYSGATAPTAYQFMFWYDTANNKCKMTSDSGSTWTANMSFPICVVETDGTKISAIKQVFNGFGFIGQAAFVLPGVKILIPYDRNTDGTLRSVSRTVDSVQVNNTLFSGNVVNKQAIVLGTSGAVRWNNWAGEHSEPPSVVQYSAYYNTTTNRIYFAYSATEWTKTTDCLVGFGSSTTGGQITELNIKQPFHAVDYNDTHFIAHQAMPSGRYIDLSTGIISSYSYTAPADGYLTINKSGVAGDWLYMRNTANGLNTGVQYVGSLNGRLFIPVQKGHTIQVQFVGSGTINEFRFIYANGAK